MHKELLKSLKKIIEDTGSNKITIFTSHLKIEGSVCSIEGKCGECSGHFIPIENALVCRLSDYCTCDGDDCSCNDYVCFRYDWLNINVADITAYSILKA